MDVKRGYKEFVVVTHYLERKVQAKTQARSHGVADATPGQQDTISLIIFLQFFYCCFIFVAKERFPKILVEINLGLFNIQENLIFSCTHFRQLIVITLRPPFALYRIHHISDYFIYQIGLPFTLYRMNPICSVSLLRSQITPL